MVLRSEKIQSGGPDFAPGVLPYQILADLVRLGIIDGTLKLESNQLQPASIDLRLGDKAWRVRASFLPGPNRTVRNRLIDFGLHQIDLTSGGLLERGSVYIVPLIEELDLPEGLSGIANPKSSTGRLDVFTRLITDGGADFDVVPSGYKGPLYLEIFPRTFSIIARAGMRLNQLRITGLGGKVEGPALESLLRDQAVLDRPLSESESRTLSRGVPLSVDLEGINGSNLVGYRAKLHSPLVDLDRIKFYDPSEFWDPIYRNPSRNLILDPEDFYILASREAVSVPIDHAAEMVPYDAFTGEFRAHYAGFFDPGFGHISEGGDGTRAVLEVRSHGVPFLIEHGQLVGRLKYERLSAVPDLLYGDAAGSSYQKQGLKLSKHFKPWAKNLTVMS